MPLPIPFGEQISVEKNSRPAQYCMPSMEISTDHYDISYIISGDRKAITPVQSFSYHAGDAAMGIPYIYHRTVSESDEPYANYLIKFTPRFIEPFINQVGKNIFDELCEQRVFRFLPDKQTKIKLLFHEMLEEYKSRAPYKEFILQGMLFRLLTTVYENKLDCSVTKYKSPLSTPVLEAVYYIENNYNKPISLGDLARAAHFSDSYFSRLFTAQMGISLNEYISNVRINHVKRLLINTTKSVTEIALDTGYCSGDYLSVRFKNKTGMTPTEFRRSAQNKALPLI